MNHVTGKPNIRGLSTSLDIPTGSTETRKQIFYQASGNPGGVPRSQADTFNMPFYQAYTIHYHTVDNFMVKKKQVHTGFDPRG